MSTAKRSSSSKNAPPSKLAKFSPDAKYVVWGRAAYPRDGWHSWSGPGEREVFAVFDDMEEANEAVKRLFYKKNPWGIPVQEVGKPDQTRMTKGLLYLMIHPDDSEVWEVCVWEREFFEKKERIERRKIANRDYYDFLYVDKDELYGPKTRIALKLEDYSDPSEEEYNNGYNYDSEEEDEEVGIFSDIVFDDFGRFGGGKVRANKDENEENTEKEDTKDFEEEEHEDGIEIVDLSGEVEEEYRCEDEHECITQNREKNIDVVDLSGEIEEIEA